MGMYCEVHAVNDAELLQLIAEPSRMNDLYGRLEYPESSISLEKAWHGLHFLLTGSAFDAELPLGFLLQGGEELSGELDGPARYFRSDVVKELDVALSKMTDDNLWRNFDPARMSEEAIYPEIWDEPEEDLREEYLRYFHALQGLVSLASQNSQALIVVVS